ncbi:MAG: nucleotide sugar dehydrogenase [Alicyclobacillaceae bacterium]|nr:nucleotide sugar dehydrogenase [Alicyclobacillaceae bacterium]
MNICIVGAGYIGQHVFHHLRTVRPSDTLIAVDLDPDKVAALRRQGWSADTAYPEGDTIDVWILCVSTGPELAWLFRALDSITPKPGALVSIESTIPVGTTRTVADRFRNRGLRPGETFHLVHIPHRVLFGVDEDATKTTRIIGGLTAECLEAGVRFYTASAVPLHPVSRPEIAELSKLVENTARYVEIAFAESVKEACDRNGLDFDELRRAVNTKGNVRLADVDYGIGGECLPKDLAFLQSWLHAPLLAAASETDDRYRRHLLAIAEGVQTACLEGLTYKPGVRSLQGSRAVELGQKLAARGTAVYARDPLLTPDEIAALGFQPWQPHIRADVIYRRGKWEKGREAQ